MEIGKIWVSLGARIDDFEKGMSDAEKAMGKVGDKFTQIGKSLTITGAAITGAMGLIIAKTTKLGDEFDDLSQRTGISTEVLSSFTLAVNKTDLGMAGFATSLKFLANNMADANTKGGEAAAKFAALGVAFKNADGTLRPLDQVMLDVADKFKAMPDGAQKSALAVDLFGRAGTGMIHMLNLGRDGLQAEIDKAKELGLVFSKDAAGACDKFSETLVDLKGGLQGAFNQIAMALIPTLTNLVGKITAVISQITAWAKAHPELIKTLGGVVLGAGALLSVAGPLAIGIGTVMKGVSALPGALGLLQGGFAALVSPVGLVIAGVTALFVALSPGKTITEKFSNALETTIKTLRDFATALSYADSIVKGTWFFRDAKPAMAEAIRKAKDEAIAFQASLTVFTPSLEKIQGVMEMGPAVWNKWKESVLATDKILNQNRETIIGWVAKATDWLGVTKNATFTTSALGISLKELGIKTKTELTAELTTAEAALAKLRTSTEATPGAIATLQDKIKGLKEQLFGTSDGFRRTVEVINTFIPTGQKTQYVLDAMAEAFKTLATKIQATLPPMRQVPEIMAWLGNSVAGAGAKAEDAGEKTKSVWTEVSTVVSDACREIARSIVDVFDLHKALTYQATEFNNAYFERARTEYEADYEARKSSIEKQIDAVKEACEAELKAIGDEYKRAMKEVDAYYDGVAKAAGKAYDEASDRARKAYDVAMEASRKYYDQLQAAEGHAYDQARRLLEYRYQDEDKRLSRQFEDEKEAIEKSTASEEEKRKKIKALTRKYEDEQDARARKRDEERLALELEHEKRVEAIREAGRQRELKLQEARDKRLEQLALAREKRMEQIAAEREAREAALGLAKEARENAAIARRTAAEQQFQLDLAQQQRDYQKEMDRIRKDEDIARDKHADDEKKRQDSLWEKIKGIVATAIEEIATAWLTSKIVDAASSIFDGIKDVADNAMGDKGVKGIIGKAATGIGNIITGLATTIGTVITTLATAIGTGIVAIATGIGTAIVTLATAIATAATVLAAAAPALAIVLGIALAALAAWGAIEKLLGGGGKQTDVTYWLKLIKDLTQESHDFLFANLQDKLNFYAEKLNDIHLALLNIRDDSLGAALVKLDGLGTHLENITKLLDSIAKNTAAAVTQTANALTSMMSGMMSGGAFGPGRNVPIPGKPYVSPWRTGPMAPIPATPFRPGPFNPIPGKPYVPPAPGKPYPYSPVKPVVDWDQKIFGKLNFIGDYVVAIADKMGALVDIEFKAIANPRDISGPVIREQVVPELRDINRHLEKPQDIRLTFNINALDGADVESITRRKIVPVIQRVFDHQGLRVPAGSVGG